MNRFIIALIFICFSEILSGQDRKISGKIIELPSGESLLGAHVSVYLSGNGHILGQTISGNSGEFSVSGLPDENIRMVISYIGHKFHEQELSLKDSDQTGIQISLENSPVPVGEVTVSALRQEVILKDVSLPLSVVTKTQLEKKAGITTSDILKNEPGIALARDGIWSTSVNIRGLTEQRILILVDGNRIETATDLTAGMAMIDINDIERVEVIKGSASSLYGTGAMGGVVNIITGNGYYDNDFYVKGSLTGAYMTVNDMNSENINLNLGDSTWYLYAGGTHRKALNTMTPEGELLNSQFSDNNISLKAGIKPFRNHELKVNYQRFFAKDVGIPGGSPFPATATAIYPRELRDMFSAAYGIKRAGKIMKEIEMKYFHQYILRDTRLIPGSTVITTPTGYHTTNGAQLQGKLILGRHHELIAGIDVWQRHLRTEREKRLTQVTKDSLGNVISTKVTIRGEVPIPDSRFTSGGFYFQDKTSLLDQKLEINFGGRFDLIHVVNKTSVDPLYLIVNDVWNYDPPNQRISFKAGEAYNTSWSADIGLLFHALPDFDLTFTGSKAFRSPSLEERFKYIDLGTTVKIGDPDLLPEDGYFFDAGARIWKDRFHLSTNLFVNSMRNLIVEIPGVTYYNYSDQPGRTDTIPALINSNVSRAKLYGFDMMANYNFFDGLTLMASASYVRGKDTRNDTDLPQIPPLSGRLGIRYNLPEWLGIELYANLMADQDKIAEGETATKGYATYDLNIFSEPVKMGTASLKIFGGIENITDRAYRNHLATNRGINKYEPGRNFYIRMKIGF